MHPQVEMFRNRLEKNLRRLRPWAARQGIVAYRLYDRDIPEVGLAIDWYDGRLHVAEYARRLCRGEEEQAAWLDGVLAALQDLCEVPPERVFLKLRERQKGERQYEKLGSARRTFPIAEGGHRFLVNLGDYVDTGLFLDHRDTRRMVQEMARGGHVLNLFGYTGSFSVYAARGGARTTTTVDLSNTYLTWAERNFAENGLDQERNFVIREDVRAFLRDEKKRRYDLIVLDPPTFSNSKRMVGVLDVQRDHPGLVRDALGLLAPGGTLLFSTNFRGLEPRLQEVPEAISEEISERTIPKDFHDRRVHRCWLLRRA